MVMRTDEGKSDADIWAKAVRMALWSIYTVATPAGTMPVVLAGWLPSMHEADCGEHDVRRHLPPCIFSDRWTGLEAGGFLN